MTHAKLGEPRYVATQQQNIRKDTITGTFQAYKRVNGIKVSKTFSKISDAMKWRSGTILEIKPKILSSKNLTIETEYNGRVTERTFEEIWVEYREINLSEFETATIEHNDYLITTFNDLQHFKMHQLTPELLDGFIRSQKELALVKQSPRYNFKRPLSLFRTICNWYRENYDFKFTTPVLKRHFSIGVIKEIPKREKKMSSDEYLLFLSTLTDEYRDIAQTQFYLAARISEIAGLQFSSLDFKNRSIAIDHVVVWGKDKQFLELKNYTKNGEIRFVHMNDTLYEIFQRRLIFKAPNSNYVFHEYGNPLSYRKFQHHYNLALKRCGLSHRFSGTHIMRHSMATITRMVTGSLESTQAITGHRDQRMVQMYASMPEKRNQEGVTQVEAHLKNLSLKLVSSGEQK